MLWCKGAKYFSFDSSAMMRRSRSALCVRPKRSVLKSWRRSSGRFATSRRSKISATCCRLLKIWWKPTRKLCPSSPRKRTESLPDFTFSVWWRWRLFWLRCGRTVTAGRTCPRPTRNRWATCDRSWGNTSRTLKRTLPNSSWIPRWTKKRRKKRRNLTMMSRTKKSVLPVPGKLTISERLLPRYLLKTKTIES